MTGLRFLLILALLMVLPSAVAQQEASQETTTEATTTVEKASPYSGSWWEWPKMTGDWGGARTTLADKGITLDIDVTQVMQHNWHGGVSTKNGLRYSGSGDISLTLDTGKMGLWPGGTIVLKAEPRWGDGVWQSKVGSLLPTNFDAVVPGYGEGCMFTLSEWFLQQVLFEGKVVLIAGKLFGARAFDRNVFANDEETQFMNVAFRNIPMIPSFLPYTTLGVGVVLNPTEWLSIISAVAESDNKAKTIGFSEGWHGKGNTTVIHEWAVKVKPFDKPGNQRVGFVWSSMDFPTVAPNEPFKSTADMAIKMLGQKWANKVVNTLATFQNGKDNVMVYYNFDQYLYTEADDPTQGIGMFGRFGWARQDVNAACHFYSIGMGGKGILPERDNDTFGIGYYFLDLSNQLPSMFHSEQGIEAYYNVQITPWLHISPDLQIIVDPGGSNQNDVAVVGGIRFQMNL